jgi:hypothetical protein
MAERIAFSRSLYDPEAVEAAAQTYGELGKLSVSVGDSDIVLTIDSPDPDVADVLGDEICNFALAETVRRARGASA